MSVLSISSNHFHLGSNNFRYILNQFIIYSFLHCLNDLFSENHRILQNIFFFTYLLRFGIKPIYNVITKEETQQPTNKRIIGGYQVTLVRKLVSNFERGIEQHIILKFLVLFIIFFRPNSPLIFINIWLQHKFGYDTKRFNEELKVKMG